MTVNHGVTGSSPVRDVFNMKSKMDNKNLHSYKNKKIFWIAVASVIGGIIIFGIPMFFYISAFNSAQQTYSKFTSEANFSSNHVLSKNDFIIQSKRLSYSSFGKSWCNNSNYDQSDLLLIYVKENPILEKYYNNTYTTTYINGQLPKDSSYYALYPPYGPGTYSNPFLLQINLKVDHPNNITLCFQVNDTDINPNIISNRVCLDTFEVEAEC